MRLRIFRDEPALLAAATQAAALPPSSACPALVAVAARSRRPPAFLRALADLQSSARMADVLALPALRAPAVLECERFFRFASARDPAHRYAFTARVPLAVARYEDLQLLFLLRAAQSAQPDAEILAVVDDDAFAAVLAAMFSNAAAAPAAAQTGLRATGRRLRTLLRAARARTPQGSADVVLVTIGAPSAQGVDTYFGALPSALAAHANVRTVYLTPGRALALRNDATVHPVEAFLQPASDWNAGLEGDPASPTSADADWQPAADWLAAEETAAGDPAMHALYRRAFERMFAVLKPHTVIYPLERRTWERHLVLAARAAGVRCCVGFQHSSITPRHLALKADAALDAANELPDRVMTCGEVTAEWLQREGGALGAHVTAGAAVRATRLDLPPPGPGVLVAISSSRAEAWALINATASAARTVGVPFIIRSHPTIPVHDLFLACEWPGNVELSRGRTLAEDLARVGAVVYSSSTVALEGMRYDRLPVYLDIGDVPSGDPLLGGEGFKRSAGDAGELAAQLQALFALPPAQREHEATLARDYARRYLPEPTPAALEAMAADMLAC
jgi:hypothetical protein